MVDSIIADFEGQRAHLVVDRNKALSQMGEKAYEYFRINAQLASKKTVDYGDLSNEREAVRRPTEKIAEIDLVLRYLRDWKKKQEDSTRVVTRETVATG